MKTINKIAALGFVLLTSNPLWAAENETEAHRILELGIKSPTVSYEGSMTVTRWFGDKTKSEEVRVRFKPPKYYRREFLTPSGSVSRIVISDGHCEQVDFIRQKKCIVGEAAKHAGKEMRPAQEWGLLEKNYDLKLVGSEIVSGRSAWVLTITPHMRGKLTQQLWIDKETGVILENKRFRPNGDFVVLSRYTEFRTVPGFESDLFVVHPNQGESHKFHQTFMSRQDFTSHTGRTPGLPANLPFGFEFESADSFVINGKAVDHLRYTDGVSVLSVFETTSPVRLRAQDNQTNESGSVMHLETKGRHYTIVGDTSKELLQEMFVSYK